MTVRYALAEIEAQARKATRGAGYAWGLAEEAGKAVRWLSARGMPGAEALADLLAETDGLPYGALRPLDPDASHWRGESALCPLIAGAALGDFRPDPLPSLGPMRQPLLLTPFAARLGCVVEDGSPLRLVRTGDAMPAATQAAARVEAAAWAALDALAHRTYVPASAASRAGAGAGGTDED